MADRVGGFFLRKLMELRDEFEVVGDVRGKGLMLGIDFVANKVGKGGQRHKAKVTSHSRAIYSEL